jgi:uncharacterized surface protein with fasciclin (FAS1) repeats
LNSLPDDIGNFVVGATTFNKDQQQQVFGDLLVDSTKPFLSAITMIAPSPDWFSGFYDFNAIDPSTSTWFGEFVILTYPMDAGTEVGDQYSGDNAAETPPGPITRFTVANSRSTGVFLTPDETAILPVARWKCNLLTTFVDTPTPAPAIIWPSNPLNLVNTVKETAGFITLYDAINAALVVEVLTEDGPFTLFAPTDQAFAALPGGALEWLLQSQPRIQQVILYHVINGKTFLSALSDGETISSLLGGRLLSVAKSDGKTTINGVAIVGPKDVQTLRGVIHVIDSVLIPPNIVFPPDLVDIAGANGFDTLVDAVNAAGLTEALKGGIFTIFAPTDAAFAALPAGVLDSLLGNPTRLGELLRYHVAAGKSLASDLSDGDQIATLLEGESLSVAKSDGKVTINGVALVGPTDVGALNGVIHVIDTVLIPPGFFDPEPTCGKTHDNCTADAECCSKRCIPLGMSGRNICRAVSKTAKAKLSDRGGAAGRPTNRNLIRGSKK